MSGPGEDARAQLLEGFERVERHFALDRHRIDEVPWWDVVRYPYHLAVLRAAGIPGMDVLVGAPGRRSLSDGVHRASNLLAAVTTRSPRRARRGGLLVLAHPRRRREAGVHVDPYTDPVLDLIDDEAIVDVVEEPLAGGHRHPARPARLWYLDALIAEGRLRGRFARGLRPEQQRELERIGTAFAEELGVDVPLAPRVDTAVRRWRGLFPVYRRFLERLRPRAILLVRSARREAFVAAARACGIPTAELQHGSPTRGKLNYDYSSGIGKASFPDLFAAFGDYWLEEVVLPVDGSRVHVLGNADLTRRADALRGRPRRDRLVVVSQPDVAEWLVPFCLELLPRLPTGVELVYRPHPAEPADAAAHRRLVEAGATVLAGPGVDLHALLAESRWQLGVYSTALYEGLFFGCVCFLLRAPGHELMHRLVAAGLATPVSRPEEVDLTRTLAEGAARHVFTRTTPEGVAGLLGHLDALRGPEAERD